MFNKGNHPSQNSILAPLYTEWLAPYPSWDTDFISDSAGQTISSPPDVFVSAKTIGRPVPAPLGPGLLGLSVSVNKTFSAQKRDIATSRDRKKGGTKRVSGHGGQVGAAWRGVWAGGVFSFLFLEFGGK